MSSEDAPTIRGGDDQISGSLQAVVVGRNGFATHALPATGTAVVGRGPDAHVRVEDGRVSRRHAIICVGPELAIEDLGSANGTRVRGRRLAPNERALLAPGDGIQLGSHLLFIQSAAVPWGSQGDPAIDSLLSPEALLSERMRALYQSVDRVARGNINVLILGETGAGKDVLAQHLHRRSPRAALPFVRVECATLSESLLGSELFGHERGSFTGAVQTKPGLLETAQGGTVFFDEVGELPPALQAKLLHALETRTITRVGGLKSRQIDARFVAATNRDLTADVAQGRFRQDLYFRLSGYTVVVPPLRERVGEIRPLARVFAEEAARQAGLDRAPALSDEAASLLERHPWPGNVRELKNVIEVAVLLNDGPMIAAEHLPLGQVPGAPVPRPTSAPVAGPASAPQDGDDDPESFDEEKSRILNVLAACGGNQTKAARVLGIARGTLLSRLDAYGVPRPRLPLER